MVKKAGPFKQKLLIMFTTNENLFQVVQCYTSITKIECFEHFEPS